MTTKTTKVNQHPHSGSKKVGICVVSAFGDKYHFPDGLKWRYAKVLNSVMLEIFNEQGETIFQMPADRLGSISGPGYVLPLWLSREYPTPADEGSKA